MQCMHFFFGLGAFVSPLIIDLCLSRLEEEPLLLQDTSSSSSTNSTTTTPPPFGGSRIALPFWIIAVSFLPLAIGLLCLPTPEQIAASRGEPARGETHDEISSHHQHHDNNPHEKNTDAGWFLNYLGRNRREREIVGLTSLLLLVYVGAEVSNGGYLSAYVQLSGLGDEQKGALYTSVYWGSLAFGRLLAVFFSLIWTSSWILLLDLLGIAVSSVGYLIVSILWAASSAYQNNDGSSSSASASLEMVEESGISHQLASSLFWAVTALYGVSMASVFPTAITLAEGFVEVTGKQAAVFVVGASLGEMVLPLLTAFLIANVGINSLFYCLVLASVLMFVVYFMLLAVEKLTRPNLLDFVVPPPDFPSTVTLPKQKLLRATAPSSSDDDDCEEGGEEDDNKEGGKIRLTSFDQLKQKIAQNSSNDGRDNHNKNHKRLRNPKGSNDLEQEGAGEGEGEEGDSRRNASVNFSSESTFSPTVSTTTEREDGSLSLSDDYDEEQQRSSLR
jgi:fucose permease